MKIEITGEQVLEAIKPVTRADVDTYTQLIKSSVYGIARVLVFMYTLGSYIGFLVNRPRLIFVLLNKLTQTPQQKPVSLERALEIVAERETPASKVKPLPATRSRRGTRSRKRTAKNASHTTPAPA